MLRSRTRWRPVDADDCRIQPLVNELGLHPLIARLLVSRGVDDPDRAKRFLNIRVADLHDPFRLDGMKPAVERIRQALAGREKIRIYGDYDADGVSSTALMMHIFRNLQADVDYYIPNRFTEGYGLNKEALREAKEEGVSLMISVDTGISAVEEAECARELGLDLIITDHHEPPETLPEALAVINPKKPGCSYPFDMLAGVGVAFKLAHALLGRVPEEVLDIAALGTIADLVPLVDENRVIAALGLERMNRRCNTGLNALLEVSGIQGDVGAGHVGFSLGPRINAGGRLDSAVRAVELLLTHDREEARVIAEELDRMNRERQKLVDAIFGEAAAMVEHDPQRHRRLILAAAPGWNIGVIGIVASRLVERFYRPAIVLGIDEETGMAKGSARSIEGFDIYRALTRCADLLPHFGGHPMAAGMTLPRENLPELHRRLDALAGEWLTEEDYIPLTPFDGELSVDEIHVDLIEELEKLAPFGMGNPTPRFRVTGARLDRMKRIGREKNHLKLTLTQAGQTVDAVGFRLGELADEIAPMARLEVLGELQINEWNNRRSPQLLIRDVCVPHVQIFDWRSNRNSPERFRLLLQNPAALFVGSRERNGENLTNPGNRALRVRWEELGSENGGNGGGTLAADVRYLVLTDLPPSLEAFEHLVRSLPRLDRLYFAYGDSELDEGLFSIPGREQFKRVYGCLLGNGGIHPRRDLDRLHRQTGLSRKMIAFMLQVFDELGFVEEAGEKLRVVTGAKKRSLTESALYRRQQQKEAVVRTLVYSSYRELCHYVSSLREMNLGGTKNELQGKNQSDRGFSATGHSL